ncbi:hypothetical protein LIER_02983 [Lithospermum erythrorhizon]|uniref:Uncharacterized protein n=1 Tax=Lithospermum erythrorhizon TaxID=34254 RepID=A0AAV3NU87_LITER
MSIPVEGTINQGFVSLETQKEYDYGPEGVPFFMLVTMITTIDGLSCRMDFTIDRKMEYLIDDDDEEEDEDE